MADNDDLTASLESAGYDFDDLRDRQALARIVGCLPDDLDALTARLKQVQMLALIEWLGWAAARGRFNSLSELDASRVLDLFLTVRQEAPTVEALVEQLAIPQGRPTSMIGRMKYGKARELMKMSFVHALREVQQRLDDEAIVDYSKTIIVSREVLERIRDVETEILLADKTTFPERQTIKADPAGRLGGMATTSPAMWNYVVSELTKRADP
jgi:hypothetical protein